MRLVLASALILGSLSCSDVSGPETEDTVAFTYTGAGGGNFSATGDAPSLSAPPTATSWSVGYIQANETYIAGSTPRSSGLIDLATLRIKRATAGSATIDPACDLDGSVSCTGMNLYRNFNGNGDTGDFFCHLTSGTIVLTEINSTRAKGTFSGSGACSTGPGSASSAFSVSNGTFDVDMVTPPA